MDSSRYCVSMDVTRDVGNSNILHIMGMVEHKGVPAMKLSNERIDELADYFIRHGLRKKKGWTFIYFVELVNRGTIRL